MQELVRSRVEARLSTRKRKVTYVVIKRVTDIVISFSLLLLFSPLLWFISYRLQKKEGAPIFDRNTCIGKGGDSFIMYSFRIMTNPSMVIRSIPLNPELAVYSSRSTSSCILTPTGIWLKRYHLYMLPRLWNVLKGEMSLVGPTPNIIEGYKSSLNRLQVKPGITGYAQVFGNKESSEQFRKNADQFYIENCSYKLDLILLLQALKKFFKNNPKSF
ncbi:sugar transferase [Oceanobacillus chungangensis]|nr:sugar transferase [Oceanobacillus chungangensis]